MLRTILIITVIGLTTGLYASGPEPEITNKLSDSQIKGKVQSLTTQDALPLAHVVVYSETSDLIKVTTTDKNGDYSINNLPVGRYYITVSYLGYKTEVVDNIIIASAGISVNMNDLLLENTLYEIEEVIVKANRINIQYVSSVNY